MSKLPPEVEEGNIEYKRQLCNLTKYRFIQLQSQMKWRIQEGNGIAIYLIGVDDDGTVVKLKSKERKESIKNIKKIAKNVDAYVDKIEYKNFYYEIVIKYNSKDLDFYEKRIAFLGESSTGKSTLISVLTNDIKDDGKGSARLKLFNHKHEMFTGTTSSISVQNYDYNNDNKNKKIVLIDLPGKKKYKKTKYYGLLSYDPELLVYVIDNKTKINNIKEYLNIAQFLKIPIILVLNKIDLHDYSDLKKNNILKNYQIIETSCITLSNINMLKDKFIKDTYTTYQNSNAEESILQLSQILLEDDIIFQICDVYFLQDIGIIVSGLQIAGELNIKNKMKLGPIILDNEIKYIDVTITSIHCHQIPYDKLFPDHIATIVIKFKENSIDHKEIYPKLSKNIYLCNYNLNTYDEADILLTLIKHPKSIKIGHQIQIYTRNIIMESIVISIEENDNIQENQTRKCKIKLSKKCYLRHLDNVIFDDGIIKGYGVIYLQ